MYAETLAYEGHQSSFSTRKTQPLFQQSMIFINPASI